MKPFARSFSTISALERAGYYIADQQRALRCMHLTLIASGTGMEGPASGSRTVVELRRYGQPTPWLPCAAEIALLRMFDLTGDDETNPPVAPITAIEDGLDAAADQWLRADPVCLQASGANLILLPGDWVDLRGDESQSLFETVTRAIGDEPGQWFAPHPSRWYLRPKRAATARFAIPREYYGRPVDEGMPDGGDAAAWIRLMNEIQMALHDHRVNQVREHDDRLPVTSVWFWGAGSLPAAPVPEVTPPWSGVWADDPLARGASGLCGVLPSRLPVDGDTFLSASGGVGNHLVVTEPVDRTLATDTIDGNVEGFERSWLQPLLEATEAGSIDTFTLIDPMVGCIQLRSRELRGWRRWWRRFRR